MSGPDGGPNSPPRIGGGGCAIKEISRSTLNRRRRGGRSSSKKKFFICDLSTSPSAPAKDASRLFLEVASTPPNLGGELCAPFNSFTTLNCGDRLPNPNF